jgi:chromosome segregation protein
MGLLRTALEADGRAEARARDAAEALREARERRETRRSRLESLREVIEASEGVSEGARRLWSRGDETRGRLGLRALVSDVLEVDGEIERAVEAVLGDAAGAAVVENVESGVSALAALREARIGRGSFVAPQPEAAPLGFVPLGEPLLGRVRARAGYEDVVRALFSGVNLVGDLREVVDVYGRGRLPATFVTPRGDLLTRDGVLRGGDGEGAESGAGLLARGREVRELATEVADLEARVERCERERREAEAARAAASDELDNLRNRHHTAALAVANHEKDLERTRERVKALGEAQEGRAAERSEILAETESLAQERERLVAQLAGLRPDRVERQRALDALGLRIGSLGREATRLETAAAERRVEHAGRAEKRDRLRAAHARSSSAASETREWIARREREIAGAEARRTELARTLAQAEETLAVRLRDEEAARASHDQKREAYDAVVAALGELDEAARALRAQISDRRDEVGRAELAVQEGELRLAHSDAALRERWGVELATWTPPALESEPDVAAEAEPPAAAEAEPAAAAGEDEADEPAPDAARDARANALLARLPPEQRRERLEQVRSRLQALGEVNLGAIEEHEELSERFRFLGEQKADLEHTLASLRDAIARINRTSRRRFRETFEAVSKRFSENFPRLFQGGKASLSLTETEDVLEAGIEIMAMPPGKRLQNVNLLSGGEKTLTAIALLVAVFQVRPSPFFLLDEVDAALDDANVGRFNDIVREMAVDSQFVLITHNKRTIEVADLLYGVTMERKGVSKLVSVELH